MQDSLKVFEDVCSAPALAQAHIVVFFNKTGRGRVHSFLDMLVMRVKDVFREKLTKVPFNQYVKEYDGDVG